MWIDLEEAVEVVEDMNKVEADTNCNAVQKEEDTEI